MQKGFAIFLLTVLGIWALMHAYVFWRLASLPWIAGHVSRRTLALSALLLASSYPLARLLHARRVDAVALPLEYAASTWMGLLFLLLVAFLAVDVVTAGGWLFTGHAPALRRFAAAAAALLAGAALVQGLRPPAVRDYEVKLAHLPAGRQGMKLVAISDLHLGTLIERRWMEQLAGRVNALKPDAILIIGDLVDGNAGRVEPLLPVLRELQAPLGVWAVTGNHEYYAGVERCVALLESAGFHVLRNRAAEVAPGVWFAGVDDLTASRQFGGTHTPVDTVLAGCPPNAAVILLSHSPLHVEAAAAAGAGLMLSGHTHNGQIWPFTHLVGVRYPHLCGRYSIGGMTLLVSRGAGTWGPRMRLWRRGEILRIVVHRP